MAGAAEEATDEIARDGPIVEADVELIRCDWCGEKKPAYEVVPKGDVLCCEDCRECDPDLDDYSPYLEYKTRVYRGVEDW